MAKLLEIEFQVLQILLEGDHPALKCLREQISHIYVLNRKMTGAGFFTAFSTANGASRLIPPTDFRIGDVNGTAVNIQHGLGFLLYVKAGLLHRLEEYTYDEPWPDEFQGFTLTYSTNAARDLETLHKILPDLETDITG